MRKILVPIMLFLLGAGLAGAETPARLNVQVQNGQIRATPSYLGAVVLAAPYGTSVAVVSQQGDWIRVRTDQGQEGWMHQSALTTKRIAMSAGGATAQTGASSEELALAGKGFNSDVEKQFKSQNPNLNFAAVVRMLQIKVPPAEMRTFLQAGAVRPVEGGTR